LEQRYGANARLKNRFCKDRQVNWGLLPNNEHFFDSACRNFYAGDDFNPVFLIFCKNIPEHLQILQKVFLGGSLMDQ